MIAKHLRVSTKHSKRYPTPELSCSICRVIVVSADLHVQPRTERLAQKDRPVRIPFEGTKHAVLLLRARTIRHDAEILIVDAPSDVPAAEGDL